MYVLIGLLLFGIFGIVAVTIDLGLVTLTRVQMQNAADAAALEGLRQRDVLGDAGRRQAAAELVANTFDDDLDVAGGDVRNLGAGPNLSVTGGEIGINASADLAIGNPPVYKPALAVNAANETHGDMVAGTHTPVAGAVEIADYSRNDFTPATAAGSATAPAFLVRLRRTNDRDGLDSVPGVSSAGAALPLLFGHASLVNGAGGGAYNPRVDGFTTRGTAIAASRPAARIGTAAATSYALDRAFWETLPPGAPTAAELEASGGVRVGTALVGRFIVPARVIGEFLSSMTMPPAPVLSGYVPVFENINGLDRVIGFGRVTVFGGPVGPVSITREAGQMAPSNASAQIVDPPALAPADWAAVLAAHRSFTSGLQVPVLVQ